MKLYLEAGHGGTDPGAVASCGTKESRLTLEMRNGVTAWLRKLGYTGTIVHDPDNANLSGAIAANKPSANDLLVGIHFNSGGDKSTGTEVIVANVYSPKELKAAQALSMAVARSLGTRPRKGIPGAGVRLWKETARGSKGVRSGWLGQVGHAVIMEVCFISNPEELAKYQEKKDSVWRSVAQAIIKLAAEWTS